MARSVPARIALLALALLLAAPAALVERAALGQGGNTTAPPSDAGAPVTVPSEPQPGELLDTARGWLTRLQSHQRDFAAAHPDRNATLAEVFALGALDFLNESRVVLAQTQIYQGETQLVIDAWFPDLNASERRDAVIARTSTELNTSLEQTAKFWQRLAAEEGQLRTTHGMEYALLAAKTGIVAEQLERRAPNITAQLATVDVVEERITRLAMLFTHGPQVYNEEANELLDLARRVDAEKGRPTLPPGALDTSVAAVRQRLALDPDSSSTTGPGSNEAGDLLRGTNTTGPRVLYLARFIAFQEQRAGDALDFRQSRATLSAPAVAGNLRTVLNNGSYVPRYDGNLDLAQEGSAVARARSAGYQALLQVDARNQAQYSVFFFDRNQESFSGLAGSWDALVGAQAATFAERAMGAPPPEDQGSLLLYGGIAVAAALAVGAFVLLRKPGK